MSKHHQLKEEKINVKCNNITLERVLELKLHGIALDEHFHLDKHILKLLKDYYTFYVKKAKVIYNINLVIISCSTCCLPRGSKYCS